MSAQNTGFLAGKLGIQIIEVNGVTVNGTPVGGAFRTLNVVAAGATAVANVSTGTIDLTIPGSSGTGSPGGPSTSIQFNSGGSFLGVSDMLWTPGSRMLSLGDGAGALLRAANASGYTTAPFEAVNKAGDGTPIILLSGVGANGAVVQFHTSTQNPNGVIVAPPGSLCFRSNGTVYRKDGVAGSTWDALATLADLSGVGASSSGAAGILQLSDGSGGFTSAPGILATAGTSGGENINALSLGVDAYDRGRLVVNGPSDGLPAAFFVGYGVGNSPVIRLASGASLSMDMQLGTAAPTHAATAGTHYYRVSGANSSIYVNRSAVTGTTWVDIAAGGGGGDVFGPASVSYDGALTVFDTTSGKLIKQLTNTTGQTAFLTSVSDNGYAPSWNTGISASAINGNFDAATGVDLSADDATPLWTLTQYGTNPGTVPVLVGDRDPSGVISADAGTHYYRESGANSTIYVNRSATTGTTWVDLGAGGGGGSASAGAQYILQASDGAGGFQVSEFSEGDAGPNTSVIGRTVLAEAIGGTVTSAHSTIITGGAATPVLLVMGNAGQTVAFEKFTEGATGQPISNFYGTVLDPNGTIPATGVSDMYRSTVGPGAPWVSWGTGTTRWQRLITHSLTSTTAPTSKRLMVYNSAVGESQPIATAAADGFAYENSTGNVLTRPAVIVAAGATPTDGAVAVFDTVTTPSEAMPSVREVANTSGQSAFLESSFNTDGGFYTTQWTNTIQGYSVNPNFSGQNLTADQITAGGDVVLVSSNLQWVKFEATPQSLPASGGRAPTHAVEIVGSKSTEQALIQDQIVELLVGMGLARDFRTA